MGTGVELRVLGDDREAASAAADAALQRMAALEARLSRHRPDSELSRLNREGRLPRASATLREVLELGARVARWGDGAFDVTVQPLLDEYRRTRPHPALPDPEAIERALEAVDYRAVRVHGASIALDRPGARITLDGIGKGYIVDQGVKVLRRYGFPNVFVEAGGDLVAAGQKGGGGAWRVGIQSPRRGFSLQARFDMRERAVATSGDYMQPFTADYRLHHIVDPRTGRSGPELASATVIAPDAATADGLATLTMVLGVRRGRELLEALPGCEGYLVSKRLDVYRTSGFALV